ncbi:MAG: ABC transporter permease [Bacteriovoracaceae bacterium]|nr:ABC transporter permease [Bacteriovoracaceae bacterium]
MILKMAFRNIFRHKRRTALTALMMIGGYVLLSFSLAFVDGSYGDMISLFTSQTTGHAQIHNDKFINSESIHDSIKSWDKIKEDLKNNSEVVSFSPRLKNGALAFSHKKTFAVEMWGIDWASEPKVTTIKQRLALGSWPSTNGENQVLIGSKISEVLGLKVGDEIVLISQGADGSIANDIFFVKGIFEKEEQGVDDYRVYTDLASAQMFYSTSHIHEVAIKLASIYNAKKFSTHFKVEEGLIIRPWQEVEKDFFKAMEIDKKGNTISYSIIMFVVALGVLNTVLMSILERTKELGVLKAIGTTPGSLSLMIILESQILAMMSLIIGSIIATLLNSYFSKHGISFSEPMTYGGMTISAMYARITLNSYLRPAVIVLVSTLFVSIFPAIRAARISPLDAMREV